MPFCGGPVLFLLMNKVNICNLLHVFEVLLFGPGVFLDSERGKIGKKTMQRSMLIAHREMMPHSRPRRWQCWPAGLLKMPK